jgi:hypothetical protein
MKRTIHFAVYLYPAWWRARYGPELDALLDDMSPGFGDLLNIAKGALLMQFSRLARAWRLLCSSRPRGDTLPPPQSKFKPKTMQRGQSLQR